MNSVLIVDDEQEICETLKEQLEGLGAEVATALTGEDALKFIEERAWKLVIVDIKLATTITGMDVIRAVRKAQPKALVVAMTGYVDVGLRQEAEKLGVLEYLAKPDDILPNAFRPKMKALLSL